MRLDWLLTRGVIASHAATYPAISARGAYLSDHEAISARVSL